jgi:4-amino-4-deoxy-L-arabinose transferase-like glycosyltransferase
VTVFCCSFKIYTAGNDFPFGYHADEDSKAAQVLDPQHRLNFRHPALLIEGAILACRHHRTAADTQSVVETGRCVSAFYAAAGTTLFALAGYLLFGFAGLLLAAVMVGLCPHMVIYSHYMKEEASLSLGVAAVLAAALGAPKVRGRVSRILVWIILGLACGLATSAKYVGAASLVCALAAISMIPPRGWKPFALRLLLVLASALVIVLLINHRLFSHSDPLNINPKTLDSMTTSFDHGVSGHKELTMPKPNTFIMEVLARETTFDVWIGLGLFIVLAFSGKLKEVRLGLCAALSFLVIWVFTLSYNTIPFHRYIMPVLVQMYFLAALGFGVAMVRFTPPQGVARALFLAVVMGLILTAQGPRGLALVRQFSDDSRQRVRAWIAANVPAGSTIAAEKYAGLHGRGDAKRFPASNIRSMKDRYRLLTPFFIGDAGDLQALQAKGVDYVVVCGLAYERFFYPQTSPRGGADAVLLRHRTVYEELRQKARLVYKDVSAYPTYAFTNPDILIYRIDESSRPGTNNTPAAAGADANDASPAP